MLTHTRLQVYLSFSAGAMLGAAFFHMMPEAVRLGSAGTLRWSAVGLLALFFLERFFAFHHHEAPADPDEPCPTHPHEHAHGRGHSAGLVDPRRPGGSRAGAKGTSLHWGAAAFGLAAHSLAGGVALASAVAAEPTAARSARPGRGGLGRLPRHGRPQAGRRPDDRQPDAPRRGPAAAGAPGQPRLRR